MIPDVHYEPVPIQAEQGRAPLNLAKSLLRSVSPVHLTYLKNMGTQATLTITLRTEKGLWGLIACHHITPKILHHEGRLACELIGKSVSSLLLSRRQMQESQFGVSLQNARSELCAKIAEQPTVREGLWQNPALLMRVVHATGAAVRIDAEKTWMVIGETPSRSQIAALARWLTDEMQERSIFSTDHLAHVYKRGKALHRKASGLLAVTIPKAEHNFVMWFRGEQRQTKVWAGDPSKQVTYLPDGMVQIEPRHSFEDWKQQARNRSQPWSQVELDSALAFRNSLISIDLQRQFNMSQHAIKARDEFLSIASHELKTPLTSMSLQGQLQERRVAGKKVIAEQDTERVQQSTRKINDGIVRLIRLIDDMLDISRISTGKLTIQRESLEMCALATSVVDRMRVQFDAAGVTLNLEVGETAEGTWDRLRIEQVVWNLMSNALRYGRGAPVSVWAGRRQGEAVLTVRDAGPGIKANDLRRIFEKFERAESQREKTGLGLGLHICRHIVQMHGGHIEVESTPGEGAAFRVVLPCTQADARVPNNSDVAPHI